MDPGLLAFGFMAGAAAFFAPCCVAMLPAYVGYAVRGEAAGEPPSAPPRRRAGRALGLAGVPFLVAGGVPLLSLGVGSVVPLPYSLTRLLPDTDTSLFVLLLGLALLTAAVVALGKARATARGALFGALATLGFLVVFLLVGLPIAFLARGLAPYIAWLAVAVGVALVVLGILMVAGRTFTPRLPAISSDVTSPKGFFTFGVGYGIASLSCTFPLFLGVVAAGLASGGFAEALAVFAAYALGKGVLLVGVTAVTVAGGTALGSRVKRVAPYAKHAAAVLVIVSGAYIAYYFGRYAPGIG